MADKNFYPVDLNDNMINNSASRGGAFVDFAGLDYFWSLAKKYVDAADKVTADKVVALENTVNGTGENNPGLVQKVAALRAEVDALGGGEGGIQGMINKALKSYSTTEEMKDAIETALESYSTTEEMNGAIETAVASEAGLREAADTALSKSIDALSEVVGTPAVEGGAAASGIFKVIEDNEKTTAEALTNLDDRTKALETAKTELQDQITSMDAAYKKADAALTKAINDEVTRATGAEEALAGRVGDLETTVGDANSGLVQKVAALETKDTELSGDIEDVSKALEAHKVAKDGDAAIHVSAGDRAAWDGAVTKINAFLDAENVGDATIDTLVEIQNYITNDGQAAAQLVTRVGEIEKTVNGYTTEGGEKVNGLVENVAANAQAIVDAKEYAKEYADGLVTDGEGKSRFDAAGSAATAEKNAKAYTDGIVGKAAEGETPATGLRKEIADVNAAALAAAGAAETAAKAYTDELYGQITFVSKSQIDGLFA